MLPFKLRPAEYRELTTLVDQSHESVVVQRAKALLGLHEGLSASEIADLIDVSRQTIYNWAEAFQERRCLSLVEHVLDAPRSGRPGTALGIIDPLIDAIIYSDPREYGYRSTVWTALLLRRHLKDMHGIETSRKSVSRALARLGIRWKRPRPRLARRPDTWHQAKGGTKMAY
jgi:transposase